MSMQLFLAQKSRHRRLAAASSLGFLCCLLAPASAGAQANDCIIWSADHEEGSLYDWTYPDFRYAGGGVFNTGGDAVEVIASTDVAKTGRYSARATITGAFQARNKHAVRLMRWTDRPWDDGGDIFQNPAWFSTWMYFPEKYDPKKSAPWDPGDGGWWNIFQFKSNDANGVSQPIWTMNIAQDESSGNNFVYLYSKENSPRSFEQSNPLTVPVKRWVHFEAFYDASEDNGRITIWQDGQQIIDANNVVTLPRGGDGNVVWGIGNYTDHIAGGAVDGTATIYFDDSVVSTQRIYGNSNCGSNDSPSKLSLLPATVTEGAGVVKVPVTLEPPAAAPVSVAFRTSPETANRRDDFYGVYDVLTFAPGETRKEVSVLIVDDNVPESPESFNTHIWNDGSIAIDTSQQVVLINDDDGAGSPEFTIEDFEVEEGQSIEFEVRLLNGGNDQATVSVASDPDSARNKSDFYGFYYAGLSFSPGETSKKLLLETVDDGISEGDESLVIRLFNETGAGIARRVARVRIIDND